MCVTESTTAIDRFCFSSYDDYTEYERNVKVAPGGTITVELL